MASIFSNLPHHMTMRLLEPLFYCACLLSGVGLFAHSFSGKYAEALFRESMLYPRVVLIAWSLFAGIALI